ncbi:polyketide synthase, partial [Actinoplanes sp. NPDC048791]|uniref:polyketide synthase n=1 Tax=Actinoplanes sp. NPDC048791 TaxID=3154623 RepID=UPI0033C6D412
MTTTKPEPAVHPDDNEPQLDGIAVIGMAASLPGADGIEQYWQNLRSGADSITRYRRQDLLAAGLAEHVLDDPGYVAAFGRIDDAECFDAGLFEMTPREAALTDPQHRLMLQCAWSALEHASCDPQRFGGLIGLFASASANTYVAAMGANADQVDPFQLAIGNEKDFLATRVAYKLNLRGPALTVQTACSSSLVAVHMACESLHSGESDIALAGGVSLTYPLAGGYRYQPGGVLSQDGTCRPFDAAAAGTVPGNGVGVVVLRRLADALANGDTIHAVIRGSAVNNDGSGKMGYTAPSSAGQAEVISAALAVAGVTGDSIGFVETHGTGTPLGDPIEIAALTQAYGHGAPRSCALGAVKAGIGHLDVASGIAGFLKAVLVLAHGEIPPHPAFRRPNADLGLDDGPFFVNTELIPWTSGSTPRRAAVSSFGIGGTNAHVIVEQAPARPAAVGPAGRHQLRLSAATPEALA